MRHLLTALRRWTSASSPPPAPARRRPPLGVERLEERAVPDANPSADPTLFTPAPEDAPLAMHFTAQLTILIQGTPLPVPGGIGITPDGDELPLHTHVAGGIIDIESPVRRVYTLQDFFTVWGQPFSSQQLLGLQADASHRIRVTVDGQPSNDFGAVPLTNGEQIVISYVHVRPSANAHVITHHHAAHHPPTHHHPAVHVPHHHPTRRH